ncbi:hypothetical protein [Streptomyces showdoensis]|uniref:Lipoprotein n=1 Tax=Streptomyces showdoensis TaxID=68268 RepID=A0A2P2GW13_STREW|nr:hypothetical protein [Streptomyces showdoensis]KKZ75694.1 hypothetical protein VO63_00260 [Streptomyces showdoensis]
MPEALTKLIRAVAAGMVVAAAAGCAGTGTGAGAADPGAHRGADPAGLTALHRLPPVTGLLYTPQPRAAVAQQRIAVACMAGRGFRYAPVPPPRAPDGSAEDPGADERPRPFGLESAAPPRTASPTPSPEAPPAPGSPESTDAYARALFGDEARRVTARGLRLSVSRPGEGCLAEAEERLLGEGRMRWLQVRIRLFEAQEDARRKVEEDSAFRAATARWRACMDRARVKAQDPVQVQRSLRSEEERRSGPVAAADLRCKAETGYLTTAYRRLAAVQQRWLDEHPDIGRDWRKLSARQDEAAGEVLATTVFRP